MGYFMPSMDDVITYILDHEDDERKELVCSMVFIFPPGNRIVGYVTMREAIEYVREGRENLLR